MPSKGKKKGGGDSAPSTPRETPAEQPEEADPTADAEDEGEEEDTKGSRRDGADISKVTDFVEQKELDSAKASQAIASLGEQLKVDHEAILARERELAAVSINQVDDCTFGRRDLTRANVCRAVSMLLTANGARLAGGCGAHRCRDGARQCKCGACAARAQGRRRGGSQPSVRWLTLLFRHHGSVERGYLRPQHAGRRACGSVCCLCCGCKGACGRDEKAKYVCAQSVRVLGPVSSKSQKCGTFPVNSLFNF